MRIKGEKQLRVKSEELKIIKNTFRLSSRGAKRRGDPGQVGRGRDLERVAVAAIGGCASLIRPTNLNEE